MSRILTLLLIHISLLGCSEAVSQTISGSLTEHSGEQIRLKGFSGLQTYEISRASVAADGRFSLSYAGEEPGMGLLINQNDDSFVVVLSGETIQLQGTSLSMPESLELSDSAENTLFEQFASEHVRREQTLSAWVYLNRIYETDELFAVQSEPKEAITREINRIKEEDEAFLANLDGDSYIHYYLPLRKLVSSVSVVAQFRTEDIPATIEGFRNIDYTDSRLYRTGLLRDILESHVWLIENSGRSLDSVFEELNISLDMLLENLSNKPDRFNEISEYLFDLLEERSLFTSAEHLAQELLQRYESLIEGRLFAKLQKYGEMQIGNVAPDIAFTNHTIRPESSEANRLSDVEADYKLLVFAASWCPFCRDMMAELETKYRNWQNYSVEVVLVSLDDNLSDFENYVGHLNMHSTTDLARWQSPLAKAYHVYSIPTFYLLNNKLEIVLKPNSINHAEAWINWHLVQGN